MLLFLDKSNLQSESFNNDVEEYTNQEKKIQAFPFASIWNKENS